MPTETNKSYDCYDNANYNDEALKKCTYNGLGFICNGCCNQKVCADLVKPITIKFSDELAWLDNLAPEPVIEPLSFMGSDHWLY